MYGLDLPRYAREYQREWQRIDRFLRLRRSQDEPGRYVLERKTRYTDYPVDRPTRRDRCIQLAHGYREVFRFWPNEIQFVLPSLLQSDIQRQGGAKALAQRLDSLDEAEETRLTRGRLSAFEAVSGEAYDHLAWAEGRRVAVGTPKHT